MASFLEKYIVEYLPNVSFKVHEINTMSVLLHTDCWRICHTCNNKLQIKNIFPTVLILSIKLLCAHDRMYGFIHYAT